ncbi:MAG TPA: hypothetical protein VJ183_15685 [Chloroflexia bacterium]|nr:hypothetical protein [Chloroflexia bacterium]
MDPTAIIIVAAIVAVVVIVALVVFPRLKIKMNGPLGKLDIDGSNDPPPTEAGIELGKAKARKGNINLEDQMGGRIKAEDLDAGQNIDVKRTQTETTTDPKA